MATTPLDDAGEPLDCDRLDRECQPSNRLANERHPHLESLRVKRYALHRIGDAVKPQPCAANQVDRRIRGLSLTSR